ncbi:cell adhesion molecule CEACAM6-like [Glossophaga mutica]
MDLAQAKPGTDPEETLEECSQGWKEVSRAETEDQTNGTLENAWAPAALRAFPWTWVLDPHEVRTTGAHSLMLNLLELPSTAKLTVESVPSRAAKGKDVLLFVHSLPENLGGLAWYRRESMDNNGPLASYVIDV